MIINSVCFENDKMRIILGKTTNDEKPKIIMDYKNLILIHIRKQFEAVLNIP
jgi:hypothetical protein